MGEFVENYFTFYYVSLALFGLFGLILVGKFLFARRVLHHRESHIEFKRLNNRFEKDLHKLEKLLHQDRSLPKAALKLLKKAHKQESKTESKEKKSESENVVQKIKQQLSENRKSKEILHQHSAKVYVLNFVGDLMANKVETLREEISLLLQVATPADEIVIRLTSPGGAVAQYGLASSQLARIKQAGFQLTACVDLVAASGGYMMAAVADKIVASPFAYVGSIGVVAGIPNFHRVLQKHEVDYYLFTAGKYKRTVTPFSEVTDEGKEKFQQNLQEIYDAFQNHVLSHREGVNIEEVATGEYWLASQAKEKGLVDEIMTSDDYLVQRMKEDMDVIEVKTSDPRNRLERMLSDGVEALRGLAGLRVHPVESETQRYFL